MWDWWSFFVRDAGTLIRGRWKWKSVYFLEIVDSLFMIDYLGDLWSIDFDSSSQRYNCLGTWRKRSLDLMKEETYLLQLIFPPKDPCYTGWINPIGLNNNGGMSFLWLRPSGFIDMDLEGNRVWKFNENYFISFLLNGIQGDPFYKLGGEIAFLRPERVNWLG